MIDAIGKRSFAVMSVGRWSERSRGVMFVEKIANAAARDARRAALRPCRTKCRTGHALKSSYTVQYDPAATSLEITSPLASYSLPGKVVTVKQREELVFGMYYR
jgi:hypothetical protein